MIKNLTDYPVIKELPVNWGDMDAFAHVNNTVFFKYFEAARIAYLEKMNCDIYIKQANISIILAYIDAKFIRPLFYPDNIQVGCRISDYTHDKLIMDYALYSTSQNEICAVGTSKIVCYDYKNNCKIDVPSEFIAAIDSIEKN